MSVHRPPLDTPPLTILAHLYEAFGRPLLWKVWVSAARQLVRAVYDNEAKSLSPWLDMSSLSRPEREEFWADMKARRQAVEEMLGQMGTIDDFLAVAAVREDIDLVAPAEAHP